MVSSNKGLVNDHEQLLSSGGVGRLENVGSFLPSAGMTSFVPLVLAETSANKIETCKIRKTKNQFRQNLLDKW